MSSVNRSLLIGVLGFTFASLFVFGTVAFAEGWMYKNLGVAGAYLTWTILFMIIGAFSLSRIFHQSDFRKRFYILFPLGFFAYSVGWVIAYFVVKGAIGEWVASLLASILLAIVFAFGFKKPHSILLFIVILFITNSLGYFLGSMINQTLSGKLGMILWGLSYGVFLGAGIGLVLHMVQKSEEEVQK
jgi:hypothetical protein